MTSLAPKQPRWRTHPALAATAALAMLASGAPAGAESSGADPLQTQIEEQQALLERLQRRHAAALKDEAEGTIAPFEDPRAAPAAPALRELPAAIFDEAVKTLPEKTWGNPNRLKIRELSLDADGDGQPELIRYVDAESNLLIRQEKDRNYDGRIDATSSFEWGELVQRTLDDDDDGQPDGWEDYEKGRMRRRALDRDRDGIRDAFYDYADGSLALERHDADNDGRIDREIHYENRHRTRAEEDLDRDGRTDVWYRYEVRDGVEFVTRIERDKQGHGRPDVFETFVAEGDGSQLARREEDLDGDGQADIVSVFRKGKLVRRELASPDLRPL